MSVFILSKDSYFDLHPVSHSCSAVSAVQLRNASLNGGIAIDIDSLKYYICYGLVEEKVRM